MFSAREFSYQMETSLVARLLRAKTIRLKKGMTIYQPVWYLSGERHGVGVGGRKLVFQKSLPVYTPCMENDVRLTVHGREVWVCYVFL
jgi:hypothetical protein